MGLDLENYQILNEFNVSRETCNLLDNFRHLVIEKNKDTIDEYITSYQTIIDGFYKQL